MNSSPVDARTPTALRRPIHRRRPWAVLAVVFLTLVVPRPAAAQDAGRGSAADSRTPTGALWRSAVIPGWGQFYNRQYLKIPFVYGGIGGLIVAAVNINSDYQLYRKAFQFKAFQEKVDAGLLESNPKADQKASYDELAARLGPVSSLPLKAHRDNLRRNRDLSYLGAGLIYALSVLDAFVSAHLLDFDVGEDLSINVEPIPTGFAFRARIRLNAR